MLTNLFGNRLVVAICMLLPALLFGCARFNPRPMEEVPFQQRTVTQTNNGVRVTAAVLSAEETEALFDRPLYRKGIQPVWLEIENRTDERILFPMVSLDRNYFAPLEVAYLYHSSFSKSTNDRIDQFFHQMVIKTGIEPGQARSGFVFSNLELGTKAFNVEIIGKKDPVRVFTFLINVPGLAVDHREVDFDNIYSAGDRVDFDRLGDFRKRLENLPCCVTGETGTKLADPLNVVIVGSGRDVLFALLRSGWDETASTSSYDPTARLPWEFRYQPVKSLYLFGRDQDAAFRKSRSTLNERNQLRLWLSPYSFNGQEVWVGQISRIIRRSSWSKFVIEPDVDEARSYLLQDLWYSQAISKYGFVKGTGLATLTNPRTSLHNDNYFTDGLRLVMWVSSVPVGFTDAQFVDWEKPVAERRKLMLGQ